MCVIKLVKVLMITHNTLLDLSSAYLLPYEAALTILFGVSYSVVNEFVILLSVIYLICANHFSVCCSHLIYTGRFITFIVITNIYNKKTKGPNLMEQFTTTRKVKTFFFFFDNQRYLMCAPRVTRHKSIRYSSCCHTRVSTHRTPLVVKNLFHFPCGSVLFY